MIWKRNQVMTAIAATLALGGVAADSTPPPSGLVNSWSGAKNAVNSAGTDNGAVAGGVTFVPDMLGRAFQFNGSDSQIDFGPTAGNLGTSDFTIEYWMKTSSSPGSGIEAFLANRAACGPGNFLDITVGHGNRPSPGILQIVLRNNGVRESVLTGVNKYNDGQWHHVAWERQANPGGSTCTLLLYVDGQLNSTASQPITDVHTTTHLVMGQDPCTAGPGPPDHRSPYSGAADQLDIWNRALSAAEIGDIYHDGLAGKPLVANSGAGLPNLQSWLLWSDVIAVVLVGAICIILFVRFARKSKSS